MLKVLMLRKQKENLQKQLDELNAKREGFEAKEMELRTAIDELTDESTDEERKVVEEEVEKFEEEKKEVEEQAKRFEEEISEIEGEIADLEEKTDEPKEPEGEPEPAAEPEERNKKGDNKTMAVRKFHGLNEMQTREMFEREDVKAFLANVRSAVGEKRDVTGAGLLIPEVFLELIRENVMDYSKLYKHVTVRSIRGDGRAVIMGTIPEAVWTDCCGNINELELGFYGMEVYCWKVGGYMSICNATLEDSDIALASEIMTALGQAIGYALDKAILFGLGNRMPKGFFTRLAETSQPADYPADARPWEDLHTSNIKTISASTTGTELFREFILDSAAAKGKYARGEKVWTMSEATYTKLIAAAMTVDAGGAIVAGVNGVMPVVGGIIEVLDFIPDDMIFGGYLDLYVLAERAGTRLEQSEHARFLNDQTVFKGTARYDGNVAIAEAFVAIGIDGTTPSAAGISFAPDVANSESN